MRYLIFMLLLSFVIISCTKEDDNSTNGKFEPNFALNVFGEKGFVKDGKMSVEFILLDVEGDTPYHFLWDFGDGTEVKKTTKEVIKLTHNYKKQGKYHYKVTLVDNDKEEFSQEGDILARSKVDIVANSITTPTSQSIVLTPGEEAKVDISMTNTGEEKAAEPFTAKVYFSEDDVIDADDIVVATKEIDSLSIAETNKSTLTFNAPNEAGNYYVILKADTDSVYFEGDESNNVVLLSSQIEIRAGDSDSADVYVEELNLPNYIIKDSSFPASIKISNKGKKAAEPFSYKLIISKDDKLDTPDTPEAERNDEVLNYNYLKNSLLSNESVVVNIERLNINKLGSYYFFVVLDPDNNILEKDEENNIFMSEKKNVTLMVPGVDLTPKEVTVSPLVNISLNKTLSVSYVVKNQGDRPATQARVRMFVSEDETLDDDDKLIEFQNPEEGTLATIGPNSKADKLHKIKLPEGTVVGDNYIIVEVNYDGENRIEEENYDNNIAVSRKINVLPVTACFRDIEIENFEVLPNPAFEGSPYTLSFDIKNGGSKEVTSFVSQIFAAPYGVEITEEHLKKNFNISRLPSESSISKLLTFNLPYSLQTDKYCVKVEVDVTGVILECDEENNTKEFCFPIISRGDDNDIKTSNVVSSAEEVDAGEKININFKVENLGTTNTATFYCQAYLSPDDTLVEDKDYKFLKQKIIYNVPGGSSQEVNDYEVTIPDNIGNRTFSVFVKCDSTNLVPENDEQNNIAVSNKKLKINNSQTGCNDDQYEYNDSNENLPNTELENFSAVLCNQDIDWYKFANLEINHKFKIEVIPASQGDFDIELYKSGNNGLELVASSTTTETTEKVSLNLINPEDAGTYYLKVFPKSYQNFASNDYNVNIRYEEVGGPGIDLSLNDVVISTTNIKTNTPFNVQFKSENLKSDPSGEYELNVYISEDATLSSEDTLVYTSINPSLGLLETKEFNQNVVLTEDLETGQYFVIVKIDPLDEISETNEDNNSYFSQTLVNYTSSCEFDSLEPNSWTPFNGRIVANGRYDNLHVCSNKYDAYIVYLKKDVDFTANFEFIDDEGDIDVHLCGDTTCTYGTTLDSSVSSDDNEEISYTPTETGFYYLRVKILSGTNTYSMTLNGINEGYNLVNDKLEIVSNYLEQNESFYFKYSITSLSTKKINSNVSYKLYLSSDSELDSNDTEIYQEELTNILAGQTISKQASATLPMNIETGAYYLISKIDADDSITEIEEGDNIQSTRRSIKGTCIGDRFEFNNTIEQAEENALIGFGREDNLTICPNDTDLFAISLNQGDHIYVNLYFRHLLGDLSLRLIDRDGSTRLADSNTLSDDEHIEYTIENSGIYYIRVRGMLGELITNSYDLEIIKPDCSTLTCTNGSCSISDIGSLYCQCDDGFLIDPNDNTLCHDDPCVPNSCQENSSCSVKDDFTALCTCNENYHHDPNDNSVCVENTKTVDCQNTKPEHSSWKAEYTDGKINQNWDENTKSWLPAADSCEWTCDAGYTEQNGSCIQ